MIDPGLSFKCATLVACWRLLALPNRGLVRDRYGTGTGQAPVPGVGQVPALPEDAGDAIEELALTAGMRSRRVMLDAGWWKQSATPMIARVGERRRVSRQDEPTFSVSSSAGTG